MAARSLSSPPQHYAWQLVLAISQRRSSVLPRSRKDTARKAFERVTKKALPGGYTQLQRALASEARDYQRKVTALEKAAREQRDAAAATASDVDVDEGLQDDTGAGELGEDLDVDDDVYDADSDAGEDLDVDQDADVDELGDV